MVSGFVPMILKVSSFFPQNFLQKIPDKLIFLQKISSKT